MKVILRIEKRGIIEKEIEIDMEQLPSKGDLIKYNGDLYKVRSKIFDIATKKVIININEF